MDDDLIERANRKLEIKTQALEQQGYDMKLDDILKIKPAYNHYSDWKALTILTGFVRKPDVSMEDKIKGVKHINEVIGCNPITNEDAIEFINNRQIE